MSIPVGVTIRNMGVESTPQLIRHCAVEAEKAGLDSVWVVDHIAIPPDDAVGSGGRYLDPLATLAWLAGQTERITLGTSVIVLPYRPKLPLAKWIATVQELSGNRLVIGAGIGWMKPEFDALGVPREQRGAISDDTLRFLNDCFANEVVNANGQDFLFKPRPPKPPILIGGAPPHATDRAVRLGDGWMPMHSDPDELAPQIKAYKDAARAGGKDPLVYTFFRTDGLDTAAIRDGLARLEAIGVDHAMTTIKYADESDFSTGLDLLKTALG